MNVLSAASRARRVPAIACLLFLALACLSRPASARKGWREIWSSIRTTVQRLPRAGHGEKGPAWLASVHVAGRQDWASAFCVARKGDTAVFLTADHALATGQTVTMRIQGSDVPVRVQGDVHRMPDLDAALLAVRLPKDLSGLPILRTTSAAPSRFEGADLRLWGFPFVGRKPRPATRKGSVSTFNAQAAGNQRVLAHFAPIGADGKPDPNQPAGQGLLLSEYGPPGCSGGPWVQKAGGNACSAKTGRAVAVQVAAGRRLRIGFRLIPVWTEKYSVAVPISLIAERVSTDLRAGVIDQKPLSGTLSAADLARAFVGPERE